MTFTAVVTSHANPEGLESILNNLQKQTTKPTQVVVLASDQDLNGVKADEILSVPNRNDWGHEKRSQGINLATGEYLGFFNADDEYDITYIESLIDPEYDIIACDFVSHIVGSVETQPVHGQITSGNFVVRTSLARKVGWNHREYNADWHFIKECLDEGATFKRVAKTLYFHK